MSPKVKSAWRGLGRRLRWMSGRGWSAGDFATRYAASPGDVWGYAASPEHLGRAEWIVSALPRERFRRVLEATIGSLFVAFGGRLMLGELAR